MSSNLLYVYVADFINKTQSTLMTILKRSTFYSILINTFKKKITWYNIAMLCYPVWLGRLTHLLREDVIRVMLCTVNLFARAYDVFQFINSRLKKLSHMFTPSNATLLSPEIALYIRGQVILVHVLSPSLCSCLRLNMMSGTHIQRLINNAVHQT